MMDSPKTMDRLEGLYLVNLCLFALHEIDSAYWHEWSLFGMPGGIQLFLVLNFFMLLVPIFGFRQLALGLRSGLYYSLLLSAVGVFAFMIHTAFIVRGHPEFRLPVSLAVLALWLLVSLVQARLTLLRLGTGPMAADAERTSRPASNDRGRASGG